MSKLFDQCFDILIGHEGSFTDDPRDKGNWTGGQCGVGKCNGTKYGISAASFPTLDIKNLTLDAAKAIYREKYWTPIRGDELPPGLSLLCLDAAVNCGPDTAIRWLQRACKVPVDGRLGPMTIAAASTVGTDAAFHLERVKAMTSLASWTTFSRGWAIRLATLPFQAAELDH
jgi:lysozyme family protein